MAHIWTHPGLQGQYRVKARRHYDCTHIYGLSGGGHVGLPALMDSALFLLNMLTTCWRSVPLAGSGRAGLTCFAMHTSLPTPSSGRSTVPSVTPRASNALGASLTPHGDSDRLSPTRPRPLGPSCVPGRHWRNSSPAALLPFATIDSSHRFSAPPPARRRGHHG